MTQSSQSQGDKSLQALSQDTLDFLWAQFDGITQNGYICLSMYQTYYKLYHNMLILFRVMNRFSRLN